MTQLTAIPAFDDNYIWLMHDRVQPQNVIVVDPGTADPVIAICLNESLRPKAIFITHHHWDHTQGIEPLLIQYSIPVYGPAGGHIKGVTHPVQEGDEIHLLSGQPFKVMAVPGHTQDHIAYYGQDTLFCGDTLFAGGCGRLLDGSASQLYHSLLRLSQLAGETQVCCAHEYTLANLTFALGIEPDNCALTKRIEEVMAMRQNNRPSLPSTIAQERQTNPFLRTQLPQVITAVSAHAGRTLTDPEEVFSILRYWKDIAATQDQDTLT